MIRRSITRRALSAVVIAVSALSLATAALAAGDWPQWRGPSRDNVSKETGLLKEWPADGPKLLWKATKLGKGFSSVSVADGKIFSMGDSNGGSYVFALNEADGKPLWSTKTGVAKDYGGYPGTRSTPTYDAGSLYLTNQHGDLYCLDAKTGRAKWNHSFTQELKGQVPNWGYAESPVVVDDLVICTPGGDGGTMVAFNKKTGKGVWRTTDWKDDAHYVSATVGEFGERKHVVQLTAQTIAGVDPKTGKILWRADRRGETAVIPTPLFRDGMVFTTSGYGIGCNLFQVTAKGKSFDATQVYANKGMENHHGGVVLVGDYVYGTNSRQLLCMELKSGAVKWQDRSVGKGSTTFADGMLYVRGEGGPGRIALVEATPEGYREKGAFDQPERSNREAWAHLVITGGRMYVRDQDNLFCYDVKAK